MKKNKKSTQRFVSKEIKKNKNINDDTKKVIAFIIILIVVLGILVGLYIVNGKYVTKDLEEETTTTAEVTIDDSIIPISETFNKKGNYLVLLYNSEDEVNGFLYSGLITSYKNTDISLYSVDMSLKMNSDYYNKDGKENKEATKYEDLVITKPTLLHIKKGKIVEYITEKSEIVKQLEIKVTTTTKASK